MRPLLALRDVALQAGLSRPDHLLHADESYYMKRWWLIGTPEKKERPAALRLHHIITRDLDRHLHDHPWPFFSLVLDGWYVEERPVSRNPCFDGDEEATYQVVRRAGDFAYRRATDRHRISAVSPGGVWTLIAIGSITHWWGFYTPHGKVYWRDYVGPGQFIEERLS